MQPSAGTAARSDMLLVMAAVPGQAVSHRTKHVLQLQQQHPAALLLVVVVSCMHARLAVQAATWHREALLLL